MSVVDHARTIALEAHSGDRNKHDGELYLLHVNRVAILTRTHFHSQGYEPWHVDTAEAIAWLHDVVEDTTLTLNDIRVILVRAAIDAERVETIVQAVDGLTKRNGESNEEYYHRCRQNFWSREIKLHADMVDNFRRNHKIVDMETRARMAVKYSLGMDILTV